MARRYVNRAFTVETRGLLIPDAMTAADRPTITQAELVSLLKELPPGRAVLIRRAPLLVTGDPFGEAPARFAGFGEL